ncbi:hypothetical protein T484DRAFT_1761333 [Baffinella frigidus]|nr:hypothetical protein T484DRAFT_1761333 [Cryptophyta sp. CCMP2293]
MEWFVVTRATSENPEEDFTRTGPTIAPPPGLTIARRASPDRGRSSPMIVRRSSPDRMGRPSPDRGRASPEGSSPMSPSMQSEPTGVPSLQVPSSARASPLGRSVSPSRMAHGSGQPASTVGRSSPSTSMMPSTSGRKTRRASTIALPSSSSLMMALGGGAGGGGKP